MEKEKANEWFESELKELLNTVIISNKNEITKLDNGTILVRNLSEKGKLAYMHQIFVLNDEAELKRLQLKIEFPKWYISLLHVCNGMKIFRSTLVIHGIYKPQKNEIYLNFLPIPIQLYEIHERDGLPSRYFIFGSAEGANKKLIYDKISNRIEIFDPRTTKIVGSFPNIIKLLEFVLIKGSEEFETTHETVSVF